MDDGINVKHIRRLVKEMSDLASQGKQMTIKVKVAHPGSPLKRKSSPVAMSDPISKAIIREENRTEMPTAIKCRRLIMEECDSASVVESSEKQERVEFKTV